MGLPPGELDVPEALHLAVLEDDIEGMQRGNGPEQHAVHLHRSAR